MGRSSKDSGSKAPSSGRTPGRDVPGGEDGSDSMTVKATSSRNRGGPRSAKILSQIGRPGPAFCSPSTPRPATASPAIPKRATSLRTRKAPGRSGARSRGPGGTSRPETRGRRRWPSEAQPHLPMQRDLPTSIAQLLVMPSTCLFSVTY